MTNDKPFTEQISWDNQEKKFYIKRSFAKTEDFEKLPLSTWGLIRKVETFVLIARQIETLELETPSKMVYYKVPIIYEIKPEYEDWYLRTEITDNPDDVFQKRFLQVQMKNVNNGQSMSAPIPNELYRGEYQFLKITKGKSIKIGKDELEEAVLSGTCLGIFSVNMQNKVVS